MNFINFYKTPNGFDDITLISDGEFLTGLYFKNSKDAKKHNIEPTKQDLPIFCETKKWLDKYFEGKNPNFIPKYKFINATPFRNEVYSILETIPYGKTITYGEIADTIAKNKGIKKMSAQAVGGAVGANPICLIVPCHRVIGKNGKLVGYGGGLNNKESLLKLEKIL